MWSPFRVNRCGERQRLYGSGRITAPVLFHCPLIPSSPSQFFSLPPYFPFSAPVFPNIISPPLPSPAVFGVLPCSCHWQVMADRWLDGEGQGYKTLGCMKQDGPHTLSRLEAVSHFYSFVARGRTEGEGCRHLSKNSICFRRTVTFWILVCCLAFLRGSCHILWKWSTFQNQTNLYAPPPLQFDKCLLKQTLIQNVTIPYKRKVGYDVGPVLIIYNPCNSKNPSVQKG